MHPDKLALLIPAIITSAFHSTNFFLFSRHHTPTNSAARYTHNFPFALTKGKPALKMSALKLLTVANLRYRLSLIIVNYPVILSHWRRTTVSSETYPLLSDEDLSIDEVSWTPLLNETQMISRRPFPINLHDYTYNFVYLLPTTSFLLDYSLVWASILCDSLSFLPLENYRVFNPSKIWRSKTRDKELRDREVLEHLFKRGKCGWVTRKEFLWVY